MTEFKKHIRETDGYYLFENVKQIDEYNALVRKLNELKEAEDAKIH